MGNTVQTVEVAPSVSGMNRIPNACPASMREDDRVPPLGPRRGGKKPSGRKPRADGQQKVTSTTTVTSVVAPVSAVACNNSSESPVVRLGEREAQTRLAELAADLD